MKGIFEYRLERNDSGYAFIVKHAPLEDKENFSQPRVLAHGHDLEKVMEDAGKEVPISMLFYTTVMLDGPNLEVGEGRSDRITFYKD